MLGLALRTATGSAECQFPHYLTRPTTCSRWHKTSTERQDHGGEGVSWPHFARGHAIDQLQQEYARVKQPRN